MLQFSPVSPTHKQTEILTFTLARVNSHRLYANQKMHLCRHGVTLNYVSPVEIVIIGGAQFKHICMLNIGSVPLHLATHAFRPFHDRPADKRDTGANPINGHGSHFETSIKKTIAQFANDLGHASVNGHHSQGHCWE